MAQEDKELLLKDLCTRLPYGVFLKIGEYSDYTLQGIVHSNVNKPLLVKCNGSDFECSIEVVRPYLRPMSSMTEEECKALGNIPATLENTLIEILPNVPYYIEVAVPDQIDWLAAHHFDYRGLITMGLALEAPEGIYNIKEK